MANLKKKQKEYQSKYGDIPLDYRERLEWMYEKYGIDDITARKILDERFRIINRSNVISTAITDPNFVHVYSPDAAYNHDYMKRVIGENELQTLTQLVCTPCDVDYKAFFPTPKSYNKIEAFMAEIGITRPPVKPDFDNIEKVYADMYNSNIWLDDVLTVDGSIDKFYSILLRVEITLIYLNAVYNKQQFINISNRKDFTEGMNLYYV